MQRVKNNHQDNDIKESSKDNNELEKTEEVIDLMEKVPEEDKQKIMEMVHASHYSGPIPPPELLRQFDEIIPNGADRIFKMTEEQSAHRREIEKSVVDANNRDSLLGILFGGVIGITGVLSGAYLISLGHPVAGTIFSGGTLVSLVGVYIRGTKNDYQDLENKRDNSDEEKD